MKMNLVSCMFILESEKNDNIRKNDVKKIKVLVNKNNELPSIKIKGSNLKKQVRDNLSKLVGNNKFHLEQVYAMDYKNDIDIIYLGLTNIDSIHELNKDYNLIEFCINDNKKIIFGDNEYSYKTIEVEENNNIEYIHEIDTSSSDLKRTLMNLLISYKKLRSNIDNTDIIFKLLGDTFTLEDVRKVYELIKDTEVDKSNFRKKIIKYCEEVDNDSNEKNGYRPSKKFKFKPLKGDVWL